MIFSKLSSFYVESTRNITCKPPQSPQSISIWRLFKDRNKTIVPIAKPALERCRRKKAACDPDLSRFGGKPFKTCGSAYVIQKDRIPAKSNKVNDEDLMLKRMEADPSLKDAIIDPMPPFKSVEQRLIDLTERKLHPFYKILMSMPKRQMKSDEKHIISDHDDGNVGNQYKTRSGPIQLDEIPDKLKIKKELLEKKNIFADFKRIQLPRQMVARIVEMERNRKPTLEKKKDVLKCPLDKKR